MSETSELIEKLKNVSTGRDTFQAALLAKSAINSAMAFVCRAGKRYDVEELSYVERLSVPAVFRRMTDGFLSWGSARIPLT